MSNSPRQRTPWFFMLVLAVLVVPASFAFTINSISVTPQNATTTASLSCLVNVTGTGTLAANITWYRSGTAHSSDNEQISLTSGVEGSTTVVGNIEAADTTKGDVWVCQATVFNGTLTNATNSTGITIVNTPPVLTNPTTTQFPIEDTGFSDVATAFDADGDSIVTWISSDLNASQYAGVSLFTINAFGAISFTPDQDAVGNHTVALLAFDGESFGGQNIVYSVVEVNDNPVFSVLPTDRNATVGVNFTITLSGSDEENDPFNFSMQSTSGNLLLNVTSSSTAEITFVGGMPTVGDIGIITVNVSAFEIANNSANTTVTFVINVSMPNQEPVLDNITNQTGVQGAVFTLQFNATDSDTGDMLIFNTTSNCSLDNPWTVVTSNNSSSGAVGILNLTLNNSHVACPYVNISVIDYEGGVAKGGRDSQIVYFNITNVNDAPVLSNISANNSNSQSQQDMRNLTAGTTAVFTYLVNGSDPDQYTYEGDTIVFTDDSALFTINSSTGLINFTPGVGDVGNYLVTITLTDLAGLDVNATLNLTIVANDGPQISSPGTITCQEDAVCAFNVTATDVDAGENLTFTSNDSLVSFSQVTFNISQSSTTYVNDDVGNYSITLTVSDRFGHTNQTTFNLVINNTNDAPFFDDDLDGVGDTLAMPDPVVAGVQTTWVINVTDVDLNVATDNLTFSSTILVGTNTSLFSIVKNASAQAYIQFNPGALDTGDYSVNISVTDLANATDWQVVNFSIVNASSAPLITAVQPYTTGAVQTNTSLTAIANTTDTTNITFDENDTVQFNLTYADNDSTTGNISLYWYVDGTLYKTSAGSVTNLSYTFDFFSAGLVNVTVIVQDNLYSQDTFTWLTTVNNVNRAPVLASNFPNRTINSTTTLASEMARFIDPDDDLDSDLVLDVTETSTLNYSMSSATVLTASFSDEDVTLVPSAAGVETVVYTATDSEGLTVNSNSITYTVVYNPTEESASSSTSSSSSGGGGGGGASSSTVVTRRVEEPKPYALDILTPKAITIYENETVIAPLSITNTGTLLLSDITLHAKSEQNVTLSFLDDSIEELAVNESYNTSLSITNFRYQGTYEIFVTAAVGSPEFNDSAVIYVNSLEKSQEGENAVNVRITYARDLLTENPACGELVQLVNEAEQAYKIGDPAQAEKLLGAVTEGCTYLKAQASKQLENPSILMQLAGFRYTNIILGVLLIGLLVIGGTLVAHYAKQQ